MTPEERAETVVAKHTVMNGWQWREHIAEAIRNDRDALAGAILSPCRCVTYGRPGDPGYQDHIPECRIRREIAAEIRGAA